MKNLKTNQAGTAYLVIIAVVMVVVVIGFVGWRVYIKQDSKSASSTAQTSENSSNQTASSSSAKNTQNGNILEIPEMGIKLIIPDSVTDLYYVYGKTQYAEEGNVASISTTTLKNLDPECGADKNWTLSIQTTQTPDVDSPPEGSIRRQYPEGVTINGTYYYQVITNGACSNDDRAVAAQVSLHKILKNDLPQIEKL